MIIEDTKLTMIKGDTEYLSVDCCGYKLKEGDIIEMTVRKEALSPVKQIYKKVEEFENGIAIIKIEPEDTSKLAFGTYKYDIQITFGESGDVKTIIPCSNFIIKQEVTYD